MRNQTARLFLIVAMLLAITLLAEVPRTLKYQGKLTDPAGIAVVGDVDITFRIYDVETGGTAL